MGMSRLHAHKARSVPYIDLLAWAMKQLCPRESDKVILMHKEGTFYSFLHIIDLLGGVGKLCSYLHGSQPTGLMVCKAVLLTLNTNSLFVFFFKQYFCSHHLLDCINAKQFQFWFNQSSYNTMMKQLHKYLFYDDLKWAFIRCFLRGL